MDKKRKEIIQDVEKDKSYSSFRLDSLILIAIAVTCLVLSAMKPIGVSEGIGSIVDPAVFVVLVCGYTTIKNAILYLRKGSLSSDVLMSLAILGTCALGVLVALNVINSDKNWFFISAIFAIISNVVYFIQNEIFSRSEFDINCKKIKKVHSTRKVCNVLSIVGILLSGAVFCVNYFVFRNEIIVCVERTIYTLVVFTPTAIALGSVFFVCFARKRAKKRGILYTDISQAEKLLNVKTVVFDENVLVDDNYEIEKVLGFDKDKKDILSLATAVYKKDDSFARALSKNCNSKLNVLDSQNFEGGAKGTIGNSIIEVCNPKFLADNYNYDVSSIVRTTYKVLFVVENGLVVGAILFGVKARDFAKKVVDGIKSQKRKTILLSSNSYSQIKSIQNELGIGESYGDLTQKDKEYRIVSAKIINNGDTLFITENDDRLGADFLMRVSDNVQENADIVANKENVANLPFTLKIVRRVFSKIKFAIILNFVLSILLAVLAGVGFINYYVAGASYLLLNLITYMIATIK